jgi:soluble lytic murein transglycosylase
MPHRLAVLIMALLLGGCKMLKTDINDSAKDLARRYAAKYEHCPYLIEAMIRQESMGRPLAVSPKGAQGLMQIMPDTGREQMELMGKNPDEYNPFNQELNVEIGCFYLSRLFKRFNDHKLALAAYNAGQGRVGRLLQTVRQIDGSQDYQSIEWHLPVETREYVYKIMGDWERRRNESSRS